MGNRNWTTTILWFVYFALLGVLFPHTAWAFRQWEPIGANATVLFGDLTTSAMVSYVAAFAFEAAIAVLTHKLAKHIEKVSKLRNRTGGQKFVKMYFNPISFGLFIATAVSALANFAHAIQFGNKTLVIFAEWGIPYNVYSFAFGGILPLVSLIFARVLSDVVEDEDGPNPEVEQAKVQVAELRKALRDAEKKISETEARLNSTEEVLKRAGELANGLLAEDKRQRIEFIAQRWAKLGNASIAVIADASPSYVTEVLNGRNGNGSEGG